MLPELPTYVLEVNEKNISGITAENTGNLFTNLRYCWHKADSSSVTLYMCHWLNVERNYAFLGGRLYFSINFVPNKEPDKIACLTK